MSALLLTMLSAISVDCPAVIQMALDLDIKYTKPDYFMQYEQDCCLGQGVVCQNDRVVELHLGFITYYVKTNYPVLVLPPNLQVLDLSYSYRSATIKKLPDSLKVLDLDSAWDIKLELDTFPNLTFFRIGYNTANMQPKLPILPDSLEFLDIAYYTADIMPRNPVNLKEFHGQSCDTPIPRAFPRLPESIEILDLHSCNLFGPIPLELKSIRQLDLSGNHVSGNLTISSPNITSLIIGYNNFDRLFVKEPQKISYCFSTGIHFEADNQNDLMALQPYGCQYQIKSPTASPDCPNLLLFLKQLNMHLTDPYLYNGIANTPNCCDYSESQIGCSSNRINGVDFPNLHMNGTINATLLPNTLISLDLGYNNIHGLFPNMSQFNQMTYFRISGNQISGPIMGNLPSSTIKGLFLELNQLNGTFPMLPKLKTLQAYKNQFDGVENQWNGNILTYVDISYNKIKGIIDMSNFIPGGYQTMNFKSNYLDQVIFSKPNSYCDVSINNIPQNIMSYSNITGCIHGLQRYDTAKMDSCAYVVRMFQKMGILTPILEQNCCDSSGYVVCDANQNVTYIHIRYYATLKTTNGFAFSNSDIPPSLQTLIISDGFNQSAKIPSPFPSHITRFEATGANIVGPLPLFQYGLQTLKLSNLNLNQPWPILPNTTTVVNIMYCNLTGPISSLPPNLINLQIQGNYLTGPFPKFPSTLRNIVLGDKGNEGNSFNDVLIVENPLYLTLGDTNIYSVQINKTNSLITCDLSFSPLLNSTNLANLTMCTQYYLRYQPVKLVVSDTTTLKWTTEATLELSTPISTTKGVTTTSVNADLPQTTSFTISSTDSLNSYDSASSLLQDTNQSNNN
eukprot:NODE_892_length_3243_cov_0.510496.p1 type:complete len:848 gc:universal NODE_892_length_3243_cov_0.510496:253-2796(+)